jgi:hypothetical protein
MRALKKDIREVAPSPEWDRVIPFPRRNEAERTAELLTDFVEEARGILTRLEEALDAARALDPGEGVRRGVLRFLADRDDWVDLHDLPKIGAPDRIRSRSLVGKMAGSGEVEMERNATYPNMVSLRITPTGRETLRKMAVAEAMGYLRGSGGATRDLEIAVGDALGSLRRLAELETAG